MVASATRAQGQTGTTSGVTLYTFGSTLSSNESDYRLYYSLPQIIHTGVKTNMTFYVYLTLLSGWKIMSQSQILRVIVNTSDRQVIAQQAQNNVTLYQGGRWGPFNITLDLSESDAGLSPGEIVNATVFADLVVYEAYDNPLAPFVQDDGMTSKLTTVQIASAPGNPGPPVGRLLSSLAVGVVVVAVLTWVSVGTRGNKRGT